MESRTQDSSPRTQKKSEAKDSLTENRTSQGQGLECVSDLRNKTKKVFRKTFRRSPKKKRSSEKNFRRSPEKTVFQKILQAPHKLLRTQKIALSSSRGQDDFRGLEASRPRPKT